jgi:hypothetical protein
MQRCSSSSNGVKENERRPSNPTDGSPPTSPTSSGSRQLQTNVKGKGPLTGVTRISNEITTNDQGENELIDVLDEHVEGGIEYKTLSWFNCGVLMAAECISLGILSLPNVMATIGLVGYETPSKHRLCC